MVPAVVPAAIPPLTNSAFVIVVKPLTVYEPGRSTSPRTKIRIERSSPSVMLERTPIICSATRCVITSRNSTKVKPPTLIGPISGKFIAPSRETANSYSRFRLPKSCTLTVSPGPMTYSEGTGTSVAGAKVVGTPLKRS